MAATKTEIVATTHFRPIRKNKLIVLIIDTFGLGVLGLDRIYLGCYLSGVLKFATLVMGTLLVVTPNTNARHIGTALLAIAVLWNIVDTFSLFYNAITQQQGLPYLFCKAKRPVRWVDQQNIVDGKNFGLALLFMTLVFGGSAFSSFKDLRDTYKDMGL